MGKVSRTPLRTPFSPHFRQSRSWKQRYSSRPIFHSCDGRNVICLLDYIKWSGEERDLHIVGVSLGGMVAQELAARISHRIISLTLTVTTAGGNVIYNLPPWKGFISLLSLVFMGDPQKKVATILDMIFPQSWLDKKREGDEKGRTNRQYQAEDYLHRIQITRPQTLVGHLSQMCAGLTHYVSKERLQTMAASIPKITIVTGDEDNLVRPINSTILKEHIPQAELITWVGTGHAIHAQWPERYCELISKVIRDTKQQPLT